MSDPVVEAGGGPGVRFTYARLPSRSALDHPTRTPPGQIGVAFTAHRDLVYTAGGPAHRGDAPAGVTYLTTDVPVDWLEVHGPTEALEIHIDPELMAASGADRARSAFAVPDAVVFAAASRLRAAHLTGGLSDVDASAIGHRLAAHIARRYAGVRIPNSRPHRLAWHEVEALHSLVRDRVDSTLTLELLAEEVHRSVFEFARSFRDAVGVPPHHFVTMIRMHHAQELLRAGATVSAAAEAVGYVSRYHFRRQFRALTGTEPVAVTGEGAQERSHPG